MNYYLLDANIFIESDKKFYAFDIAPNFWSKLQESIDNNTNVYTIDKIKEEVLKGRDKNDPLVIWFNNISNDSFIKIIEDTEATQCYGKIVRYVQTSNQYTKPQRDLFLKGADPWLLAYAKAYNATVVTFETPNLEGKKIRKVKIPDICNHFKIEYIGLFDLMRAIRLTL